MHSVKLCISGNLSVGSVTQYKSVWHCIGNGWFADGYVLRIGDSQCTKVVMLWLPHSFSSLLPFLD